MDTQFEKFYECVVCTKWFKSKLSLIRHKSKHSDLNSQLLRNLRRKYLTYFRYRLRWKSYHAHHFYKKCYTCLECQRSFITTSAVESHMKMCHLDDEFKCVFCNERYGNYSELMTHTLIHADEQPYCCYICEQTFVSLTALTKHEQSHSAKDYKCVMCDKAFSSASSMSRHSRIHSDLYICKICYKRFSTQYDLNRHLGKNGSPLTPCRICGFKFTAKCEKQPHHRNHLAAKASSYLQRHQSLLGYVSFVEGSSYKCNVCTNVFADEKSVIHHLMGVHSIDPQSLLIKQSDCGIPKSAELGTDLQTSRGNQAMERNNSAKENDELGVLCKKSNCIELSHLNGREIYENLHGSNDVICVSESGHIDTDDPSRVSNENLGADTCDEANELLPDTHVEKYATNSWEGEISSLVNDIEKTKLSSQTSAINAVMNMLSNNESHTSQVQEKMMINISDAKKSSPKNLFEEIEPGVKRRLMAEEQCSDEIQVKTVTTVRPLARKSNAFNKHRRGLKKRRCQYCGERIQTKRSHHYMKCPGKKAVNSNQQMEFGFRKVLSDIHDVSQAYHCHICNKSFRSNAGLASHRKIHVSTLTSINEPSVSATADTTYSVSTSEQQMKSDPKKYPCSKCNMSFESEAVFSSHKKLHMDIKVSLNDIVFDKSHCKMLSKSSFVSDKVYRKVADVQTKTRRLSHKDMGIKQLKQKTRIICPVCKKVFCFKETFEVHALAHEKAGWNICYDCGKCFIKRISLRSHQRREHWKKMKQSKILVGDPSKKDQNPKSVNNPNLDKIINDGLGFRKMLRCSVCKKSFLKESYNAHMCVSEETVWFVCWVCGKIYCTISNLKRHQQQKHANSKLVFRDRNPKLENINLDMKRNVKMGALKLKGKYQCPLCKKNFDSKKSFRDHVVLHRKNTRSMHRKHGMTKISKGQIDHQQKKVCYKEKCKRITCSVCERIFYAKETFVTHIKSHKEAVLHFCLECGKSYAAKSCLSRHIKRKHMQSSTKVGSKRLSGMKNISHLASLKRNGLLSCSECGKSYAAKSCLVRHHKQKHKKCSTVVGNEGFSGVKNTGIAHITAHKEMGLHTCLECGKSYSTKSSLGKHCRKSHQRSSSRVRTEDITEIKNIIGDKIEVVDVKPAPQKRILNEKEVKKCPVCRRKYYCKETFKNHVLVHEKSKWYVCYHCCLCYWKKSILLEHLRTVHGENCMLTETKTALEENEDMLIDSDNLKEKEYYCSVCGNSYTFKVIFKNHVLMHEKDGWYVCFECGNSYKTKSNLDQHWVNNHLDFVLNGYDLEAFWKKSFGIVSDLNVKIKHMNPCSKCGEFYGDSRQDHQRHILTRCKGEILKIEPKLVHGYNEHCNRKSDCKILTRNRGNKNAIKCSVCKQSFSNKGLLVIHWKSSSTCRLDLKDEFKKSKSRDSRRNILNTRIFPERGNNALSECKEENNSGIDEGNISSVPISAVETDLGNAYISSRNPPFICGTETGKNKKRKHECQYCGTVFPYLETLNYHTRTYHSQREIFHYTRNCEKMLSSSSEPDKERTKRISPDSEVSCVNNSPAQAVKIENLPEPEISSVMSIPDQESIVENACMSLLPSVVNYNAKARTEEILEECRTSLVWDPTILTSAMESVNDLVQRKTLEASAMSIHKELVFKENLSSLYANSTVDDQKVGETNAVCDENNAHPLPDEISVSPKLPVTHVKTQDKEFTYGDYNSKNISKTGSSGPNAGNCCINNANVKTMETENSVMSNMLFSKELTVAQNSFSKSKDFQQAKKITDVKIQAECVTCNSGGNFGSSCTATRISQCNKGLQNKKNFLKATTTVDFHSYSQATLPFDEISHGTAMSDLSLEELTPVTPQLKETTTASTFVDPSPGDFTATNLFLEKSDKEISPTDMHSPKSVAVSSGLKEMSKESSSGDLFPDKLVILVKPSVETNRTTAEEGSNQNFKDETASSFEEMHRKNALASSSSRKQITIIYPHDARNTQNSRGPVKVGKSKYFVPKHFPSLRVRTVSVCQSSRKEQACPEKVLSSGTPGFIPKTCFSTEVSKAAAKTPDMPIVDQSSMSVDRNRVSEIRSEVSRKKLFIPTILKKSSFSKLFTDSGLPSINHIDEEKLRLDLTLKKSAIVTPLHCEARPATPCLKETAKAVSFSVSQVEKTARRLNVVTPISEHNAVSSSSSDVLKISVYTREEPKGRCISGDIPTITIPSRKTVVLQNTCYVTKEGKQFYPTEKSGSTSQGFVQESVKMDKQESVFCMPGLVEDGFYNAKQFLVSDSPSKSVPFKINIFTNYHQK